MAVGGEIFALWTRLEQVVLQQEALGSGVVSAEVVELRKSFYIVFVV